MPHLPVAGGAAASGIAAAKAAEAAAGIGPAESAAAAAAPSGAANQITQNHAGENTAATTMDARPSRANQPEEQDDSTQDHRPGNRIRRAGPVAPGQTGGKGHVLGLRDGVADGFGGRQHGIAVIAPAERRSHLAQDAAAQAIGQNRLQPITDFEPAPAVVHRQQNQDGLILALQPTPPGAANGGG